MKKLFAFTAAASLMLGFASCSSDIDAPEAVGDGNVNLTVALPDAPGTRAFSDGKTAKSLQVAVYDVTGETPALVETKPYTFAGESLSTTVSLDLATGRSYKIALFASQETNSPYTFSAEAQKITVDYTKMTDYNTADYDCFYRLYETGVVNGPISEEVKLFRPVAQVNWGTSDLEKVALRYVYGSSATDENLTNLFTKVTTKAYTEFSLLDSDVTGDAVEVTFPLANRPAASEAYPYQPKVAEGETATVNYKYLSMQYLLVPQASSLIDITLESAASATATQAVATVKVPNAPVQANYRTNIFGALLTNPAVFTVVKENGWAGADNNIDWNGEVDKNIPSEEVNGVKTYTISTPAQLAGLSALVKEGNTFKDQVVVLNNDLDLNNVVFTPIGYFTSDGSMGFAGTFDGNGKTIKNLNAVEVPNGNSNASGLFAYIKSGAVVKNLTVENATVKGTHFSGVICGYAHAGDAKNLQIKDCTVKNSKVVSAMGVNGNDGDKAGAITGFLQKGEITGCTVENVTIEAMRDAGVFVGTLSQAASQKSVVARNIATNVTFTTKGNAAEDLGIAVGRLVKNGSYHVAQNTFTNCTMNVADFDCRNNSSDDKRFIRITCEPGVALNVENVKLCGMYITQNNSDKITIKNCTFEKAPTLSDDKTGKNYQCRKGIEFISSNGKGILNVEVTGCNFISSYGHSIQFQSCTPNNITIKGNKFAGWGDKEIEQPDIETSCAIVVCGESLCGTPEARQAFVDQFLNDNTCTPNYMKNGFKYGYVRFDSKPSYVADEKGVITQK